MAHSPEVTDWIVFRDVSHRGDGVIVEADGRGRRSNGRPLANVLTFSDERNGTLATRLTAESDVDPWRYESLMEASPFHFAECPICGQAGPLTAEHVPPARLGGSVLTATCGPCNNIFGSYEEALLQRAEQRYTMAIRGPGIDGVRRISDVILRMTENHERVLTTWNGFWPDWADPLFNGGGHEVRFERRCSCLAYGALVKNGYLAACVLAPSIVTEPEAWPVAQLVRQQLVAWRGPHEGCLALDSRLKRLHVRYDAPIPESPTVALCEATHRASGERRHVLRLGWQIVIDWPADAARMIKIESPSAP